MRKVLREFLQEQVAANSFPGAGYALVNESGIIFEDFVGFKATYPEKLVNEGNEIYDIASLTKVVSTTSLIMKLIEDKKLKLNDYVYRYLPRFLHKEITIYHLLTHTSGLPADIPRANTLQSADQVKNIIYTMALIHLVGEKIVYSDIGFIMLGWVIEEVTHRKLDQYAKETLFDPLGMFDTGYHPDPRRCAPTEYRDDSVYRGVLQGMVHDEKAFALGGVSGHAGLFSTPHDLCLFMIAFLRQNPLLFEPETIDALFLAREERIDPTGSKNIRALGWAKPTKGGTAGDHYDFENTILHTGFTGCNLFIDRKRSIGFVLLGNGVHPKREKNGIPAIRNQIGNMILPDKGDFEV